MTHRTWTADIEGLTAKEAHAARARRDSIRASRRAAAAENRAHWKARDEAAAK